ncbi:MAG: hypothetical protein ACRED3_04630, partial [Bradyrhizobium sp.]
RSIRKNRPNGLLGLRAGLDELTVQNILAPSHQPQDRPIGYRQQNDTENTDLKHRSRPIAAVSRERPFSVKTAESDCLSVRCLGTIIIDAVPGQAGQNFAGGKRCRE